MKIDTFAICYNEEKMLPYFLRHYSRFSNITIYDNMSNDSSRIIMKNNNVNMIEYDTANQIRDDVYLEIKNNCWKKSTADWVIVCDIDEIIYHKNLINILENTSGTIIKPTGYQMISENFPSTPGMIYDELQSGIPLPSYSKPCVFSPTKIKEINFHAGCHVADPIGEVFINTTSGIQLLHYKYLNRDLVLQRHKIYKSRLSDFNKAKKYGIEYDTDGHIEINNYFDNNIKNCKNIING